LKRNRLTLYKLERQILTVMFHSIFLVCNWVEEHVKPYVRCGQSQLEIFQMLDFPLMVGLSRKSTVYKTLGIDAANALNGTTVLHTIALLKGARILRVHDVKEARETVKLLSEMDKLKSSP
ncbi:MAG: dihydropteroate synthase, partial [Chitinophagales bacterium]